ncbi:hypothetical protein CHA01nite_30360 [Chryseobacterium hagamense]|uniref:Uncharacterized protein n=2 Tax=Chryseobacterium hagamense TaxID=395935 RepID=A0A511YQ32_9FLAO|nr:hypothetical protein CHA01nite_30360 [Chryseobacterium hagamense]
MLMINIIFQKFLKYPGNQLQNVWIRNKKVPITKVLHDHTICGKTKIEVKELFGEEKLCDTYTDKWKLPIKTTPNKKYFLVFYFEDEQLAAIRYKYKVKEYRSYF